MPGHKILLVLLCVLLFTGIAAAEVPRLMNYQGVLTDTDGIPTSGNHDLTFRIYGGKGNSATVLWEESHTAVEIREGVFSVILGSVAAMPDGLFASGEIWLGVRVDSDPEIAPRTRITPVPWALRAGVADVALRVSEESYPRGFLAREDVSLPGIINDPSNPVDWSKLKGVPPWLVEGDALASEAILGKKDPEKHDDKCKKYGDNHSLDAVDCDPMDVVYVNEEGNVGIGTHEPLCKTEMVDGEMTARFGYHEVPYPGIDAYSSLRGAHGDGTFGYLGRVLKEHDGDRCYGAMGAAIGRAIENVGVYGIAYGGFLGNYAGLFAGDVYVRDGKLTVGSSNPDGSIIEIRSTLSDPVAAFGKINFLNLYEQTTGAIECYGPGRPLGSGLHFRTGMENTTRMVIRNSGRVGIGTEDPDARLVVAGEGDSWRDGFIIVRNDGEDAGIQIHNGSQVRHHIFNDAFMNSRLRIAPNGDFATGGITITQDGNVGVGHTLPFRRLTVDGHAYISGNLALGSGNTTRRLVVRGNILIESEATADPVLELGEGLDYAEGFDVSAALAIEPGTVLSIDPENPGKLSVSDEPYDTKVAGIVAGGKGLGSGVRLGVGQFDYDVALAGRVYCNVVATGGAIQPGDLLTTSAIPGYAMKATDYACAQGAILGKAMEGLEAGEQGQMLVLVTLQ
jgi:hypothetical protein